MMRRLAALGLALALWTPAWPAAGFWPVVADDPDDLPVRIAGADVRAVATAPNGDLLVTGSFRGQVTFPGAAPDALGQTLTSTGDSDVFVARYDPAGNFLWALKAGGSNDDVATDIAVHSDGKAYVVGTFRRSASFGNTLLSGSRAGAALIPGKDYFVAQLDTNLVGSTSSPWLWARSSVRAYYIWKGSQTRDFPAFLDADGERLDVDAQFPGVVHRTSTWFRSQVGRDLHVGVDASGNVYLAGSFRGTLLPTNSPDKIPGYPEFGTDLRQSFPASDEIVSSAGCQWLDANSRDVGIPRDADNKGPGNGCFFNLFVEKYDAQGSQQWFKQGGSDAAGMSTNCGDCSAQFAAALDGEIDRNELPNQQSDQFATDLAVTPNGSVFVVGTSAGETRGLASSGLGVDSSGLFELWDTTRSQLAPFGSFVAKLTTVEQNGAATPSWAWMASIDSDPAVGPNDPAGPAPRVVANGDEVWVSGVFRATASASTLFFRDSFSGPPPVHLGGETPTYPLRDLTVSAKTLEATTPVAWVAKLRDDGAAARWQWVEGLDYARLRCDQSESLDSLRVRGLTANDEGLVHLAGALGGTLTGDTLADPASLCAQASDTGQGLALVDQVPVGTDPRSMAAGDLDGDGDIDLVTASLVEDRARVTVLENDGAGSFSIALDRQVDSIFPFQGTFVTLADVDGDDDLDIVWSQQLFGTGIRVLRNDGDLGFHTTITSAELSLFLTHLTAADFDGDGDLDLAAPVRDADVWAWLRNDGTGAFTLAATISAGFPFSNQAAPVGALDWDGDGDIDVATASDGDLGIYVNNGSGGFTGLAFDLRSYIWLTVTDLRGVGPDLVFLRGAGSVGSYEIRILGRSVGDLTFSYPSSDRPNSVIAVDLDGDGDADLVTANGSSPVQILRNGGSAGFALVGNVPAGAGGRVVVAEDFDGDGDPDLAVLGSSDVRIYRNDFRTDALVAEIADHATLPDRGEFRWARSSTPAAAATASGASASARALSSEAGGGAFVAGSLASDHQFGTLQMDQTASGGSGASFVAQIDREGEWAVFYEWTLGERVVAPAGADPTLEPDVEVSGFTPAGARNFFYWDAQGVDEGGAPDPSLYAVRPTLGAEGEPPAVARLRWRVAGADPTDPQRVLQQGVVSLPEEGEFQPHVSGAPVDLRDADGLTPIRLLYAEGGGSLTGGLFAAGEGFSVVLYVEGDVADEFAGPVHLQIVKTGSPVIPAGAPRQPCTVGEEIPIDPAHTEGAGRNGYVLLPTAPIDGFGSRKAYDPATRLGRIIPVNAGDVDIAWYQRDASGVAWPAVHSHYRCTWPENPQRLVIASQLGSELLVPVDDPDPFADGQAVSSSALAARAVAAADLDRDGDPDVVTAAESAVVWHENHWGEIDATGAPLPRFDASAAGEQTIAAVSNGVSVAAADLDRDGDPDVLSASDAGVAWYENLCTGEPCAPGALFDATGAIHGIATSIPLAVLAADLDRDGDADVLSASSGGVVWYENLCTGEPCPEDPEALFAAAVPIPSLPGTSAVGAADLDGDGDLDVLSAADAGVAWHENLCSGAPCSGAPLFGAARTIASVAGASSVTAADLDWDGDPDALVAVDDGSGGGGFFWVPNRSGETDAGSPRPLFDAADAEAVSSTAARAVLAVDLDRDDDQDVLAVEDRVSWYEHEPPPALALDPLIYAGVEVYRQPDESRLGFNPNEEHAFLAPSNLCAVLSASAPPGAPLDPRCAGAPRPQAVFALRRQDPAEHSEPYVLLKWFDGQGYAFRVLGVQEQSGSVDFSYAATAGKRISPPYPLSEIAGCAETRALSGLTHLYLDYQASPWARSAGALSVGYFYPVLPSFFEPGVSIGDCVPFLDQRPPGSPNPEPEPLPVAYQIAWPPDAPVLRVGETLLGARRGLPDVAGQQAVTVAYDPVLDCEPGAPGSSCLDHPLTGAVQLIDPTTPRSVPLPSLPPGFESAVALALEGSVLRIVDPDFPLDLQTRVFYDEAAGRLGFEGEGRSESAGDPLLLPNVMTPRDRAELLALADRPGVSQADAYRAAVDVLFFLTRNPNGVDVDGDGEEEQVLPGGELLIGLEQPDPNADPEPISGLGPGKALSAGAAKGEGYVTLAFNDDPSAAGSPVELEVIRVACDPYQGRIEVLPSPNVFDERLSLRHNGDFAGAPERYEFEWYIQPDVSGVPPDPPQVDPDTHEVVDPGAWVKLATQIDPTLGSDLGASVGGSGQGELRFTIAGGGSSAAARRALVDNWLLVRYREIGATPLCGWSPFAGSPAGTRSDPEPQLAEGWIKRVVLGLNAFEARVHDFHAAPTQTFASLLVSAGERFEGPVALSPDPANLNQVGLIEAYTTALRRARELTIDADQPLVDFSPSNNALLLAAGRIADLYMALGNEAFADALDPTIGFTSASGAVGTLAPAIFAFQNQLPSLLDEELALLRGRDASLSGVRAAPFYNRLQWNFTSGDGEIAYQQNYAIGDPNQDGVIDEDDARILFPQGHGDAWGHYLTAIMAYYALLVDPDFRWEPRVESVSVSGAGVPVDFLDERKFAAAAAARARTGAEIVDLTYRKRYVEDAAGQWQGYEDPDAQRAWGLSGWARRAGKGAYYDWVVANSLLPEVDPDPSHVGIQKIDRQSVEEIGEISAAFREVQQEVDEADRGLNPLGLAKGVVPFDIDPSQIDAGMTHFEQVQERALGALDNAVRVFDHANELSNRLRENQDSVDDFTSLVGERERDFTNRLIEVFGTPYLEDIGPGGTYPSGYEGPDLFHYNLVDQSALTGDPSDRSQTISYVLDTRGLEDLGLGPPIVVEYDFSEEDFSLVRPAGWTRRRAPGELQLRLSELLVARADIEATLARFDSRLEAMRALRDNITAQAALDADQLEIATAAVAGQKFLNQELGALRESRDEVYREWSAGFKAAQVAADCVSTFVGADVGQPEAAWDIGLTAVSCALGGTAATLEGIAETRRAASDRTIDSKQDQLALVGNQLTRDLLIAGSEANVKTADELELARILQELPALGVELDMKIEIAQRSARNYLATLARAQRLIEERVAFRRAAAAETQEARYRDVAFRIFRNDALQKYRAAFDLAARYAFLAATAYDYETNLRGDQTGSGERFLTDIVKQRALGQVIDGVPVPGSRGLADPLARLSANFAVQKGQLGFDNPQTETNRFSLRNGNFRKKGGVVLAGNASQGYQLVLDGQSDTEWRAILHDHAVDDLWEVPEFRRFARPFAAEFDAAGNRVRQPGIVIPFDTRIEAGANFFGEELGPGDSAYDATNFATKVRTVGVWLSNYECLPLSNTPRVYLVPAGMDVLRSPEAGSFATRQWRVVDQSLPVPFPIGALDLEDPAWIPSADSLSEPFGKIRRLSSFRAFPDGAELDPLQTTSDSRLIGRSVWNTRWLLIIPGQNLLFDAAAGLDILIDGPGEGQPLPAGCSDDSGLKDIRIFFQTYAISGN